MQRGKVELKGEKKKSLSLRALDGLKDFPSCSLDTGLTPNRNRKPLKKISC